AQQDDLFVAVVTGDGAVKGQIPVAGIYRRNASFDQYVVVERNRPVGGTDVAVQRNAARGRHVEAVDERAADPLYEHLVTGVEEDVAVRGGTERVVDVNVAGARRHERQGRSRDVRKLRVVHVELGPLLRSHRQVAVRGGRDRGRPCPAVQRPLEIQVRRGNVQRVVRGVHGSRCIHQQRAYAVIVAVGIDVRRAGGGHRRVDGDAVRRREVHRRS